MGRVFLGRYEPIRLLGEGGMGKVYLARQTDLGRQVVVKVMHDHIAADPKFRERFQRETLLMARFQHPYVVTLFDASLNDPQGPCIVMEYIRGVTLDTLLHRNSRLTPARVGRLLNQLCEALQAAHDEGIIHRDLKPANLMVVDPDTPYEKIKVTDFGLAKLFNNESSNLAMAHKASETAVDFAVGTPGYISPEQVRGEEISFASDIYSVGVILFELLTGKLPFVRDETMDVLLAHATDLPPSFESLGAGEWASRSVEAVVQNCLAKKPSDRPAGARELAKRYESALFEQYDPQQAEQGETAPAEGDGSDARPAPTPIPFDPNVVVHQLEAWMPDVLATCKLRGFVNDMGGEVLESVPGRILVRLGPSSAGNWFGLRRKASIVDMELLLERNNPRQPSQLLITVKMRSPDTRASANPVWRERCGSIFCELRGYLAGASVGT